jgi:hypothetical protein
MNEQLSRDEIISMLRSHAFGVLATYGGEYPYTSLISLDLSADGRLLIFPTMRETNKYTNILHEGRVSVLLDNRAFATTDPLRAYALTVLGRACEVEGQFLLARKNQFLMRHPNLTDFLSKPQTALVGISIIKIILVERFQDVQRFDWDDDSAELHGQQGQ